MNDINATLAERGKRYGSFETQARIAQSVKVAFQATPNWFRLHDDQREALDMIANKVARILNGSPDYVDSWVDIAGYAKLIVDRLSNSFPTTNGQANPPNAFSAEAIDASGYVDRFSGPEEPAMLAPLTASRDWLEEAKIQAASAPSCEG
jgi:Domain of unknown function (DUF6378)